MKSLLYSEEHIACMMLCMNYIAFCLLEEKFSENSFTIYLPSKLCEKT